MRGEHAIFNLEIKKKSGLSINPDIHHSKVFSSACIVYTEYRGVVRKFSRFFFLSRGKSLGPIWSLKPSEIHRFDLSRGLC